MYTQVHTCTYTHTHTHSRLLSSESFIFQGNSDELSFSLIIRTVGLSQLNHIMNATRKLRGRNLRISGNESRTICMVRHNAGGKWKNIVCIFIIRVTAPYTAIKLQDGQDYKPL